MCQAFWMRPSNFRRAFLFSMLVGSAIVDESVQGE